MNNNHSRGCHYQIKDQLAIQFLEELQYFWSQLASEVEATATASGWLNKSLDKEQYCISPSDFGFHNALLKSNGDIKFIDFEYAGFDDPAKITSHFSRIIQTRI